MCGGSSMSISECVVVEGVGQCFRDEIQASLSTVVTQPNSINSFPQ